MPGVSRLEEPGLTRKAGASYRRLVLTLSSLVWLAGCGGAPVKPTESLPPPQPAPTSGSKVSRGITESEAHGLDPKTYVARFHRPSFCEQAARTLKSVSSAKAWEVLAACIDKGDFKLLDRLLEEPWLNELRTRSDAPRLIAKVIAARGGDDVRDGATLRNHKIPLFTLEAAVRQPGVFRGQLLLLRASVVEVRVDRGDTTARLLAKGFMRPSDVHILVRLVRPDPILERGKDLIFVARFQGLEERPGNGEHQGEWIAVLSVIGYSEPAAAVVE